MTIRLPSKLVAVTVALLLTVLVGALVTLNFNDLLIGIAAGALTLPLLLVLLRPMLDMRAA